MGKKGESNNWSEETCSVAEIREKCDLPKIVKIDCEKRVESDADLDLYQPLLLYKAYKSVKVQARLLYRHRFQHKDVFQPYGNMSLVIPKGYTGLFALLDENGFSTAKRFMLINDLMKASGRVSSSFLIHNCVVQGFRRISDRHYKRTLVTSGTILRATGIFTDQSRVTINRRTDPKLSTLRQSLVKFFAKRPRLYDSASDIGSIISTPEDFTQRSYLKCLNAFQEEFYIPLTTAGTFYLISDTSRSKDYNKDCIHLMSTIITHKKMPCNVKLVCGYLPEMQEHFSGYLQLDSVHISDVILACTMHQPPYQLFEVDLSSEFEFRSASLENAIYLDRRFRAALGFAKAQSDAWRRQIKIAHQVTVDGEEEEHIYAEIGVQDESPQVFHVDEYSPSGSSHTSAVTAYGSADTIATDAMSYRLSVLSYPSRISFA